MCIKRIKREREKNAVVHFTGNLTKLQKIMNKRRIIVVSEFKNIGDEY